MQQVDKEQYAMKKKAYMNAQTLEMFYVHKNKLAQLAYTGQNICQALVND